MTLSLTGPQPSKTRRWWRPTPARKPADVSPEFHQAFVRGVMQTERLRMKTLIAMSVVIGALITTVATVFPGFIDRVWNGPFNLWYVYSILGPFVVLESMALAVISHEMAHRRDLPIFRRYLNAFIETSMPTLALAVQMIHMGDERALNFVIPLFYFMFIILSTLRLDFWLSAFTGFVAGSQFLLMALFFPAYHATAYDPWADPGFHIVRSVVLFGGGVLAGAVGAQLRR
jgi:adenylate cyclase